ncbi:uncharacterized protein [Rutidosis leptorrhynchoides]|uniref:uncharacterized protein n=1 Tax=Rutidosis leptorrhynchoides TaxID=125765 RepID=UPI003A99D5A8
MDLKQIVLVKSFRSKSKIVTTGGRAASLLYSDSGERTQKFPKKQLKSKLELDSWYCSNLEALTKASNVNIITSRKQLALPDDSAVTGESELASLGANSLDMVSKYQGLF